MNVNGKMMSVLTMGILSPQKSPRKNKHQGIEKVGYCLHLSLAAAVGGGD